MVANLCLHCTQGSEQSPLCLSSDFKNFEGLHGVKLSAYARLTSVLRQLDR
jgi:hypothetical protein